MATGEQGARMVMTKVAQLRGRDPPDEDAGEDSDAGSGADARSDEDEPADMRSVLGFLN